MKLHLSSLICGASSARSAAEADAETSRASNSGATHRGHDVHVSSGSGQEPASNPRARRSTLGRLGRAMRNAIPGRRHERQQRPAERQQGMPDHVPLSHYLESLRREESGAGTGRPHDEVSTSTSGRGETSAHGETTARVETGGHGDMVVHGETSTHGETTVHAETSTHGETTVHAETSGHAGTGGHHETVTTQSGAQGAGGAPHHDPDTHAQLLRIKAGFDAKRQDFDKRMGIASNPKSNRFLACFGKIGGSSSRPSQAAGGRAQGASTHTAEPPPNTGRSGRSDGLGGSDHASTHGFEESRGSRRTDNGEGSGRIPTATASELSHSSRSDVGSSSERSVGSGTTAFSEKTADREELRSDSERSLGSGTTEFSSEPPTSERSGSASFSPGRTTSSESTHGSSESGMSSPERPGERPLPSLTQAASEVQLALSNLLRDASPEVREGSAQAGALLREEPIALPLTPIAQLVRNALDEAARELSTASETATFASARSNPSESESQSLGTRHEPALQRSPSQSSDEDVAFFRSMEGELGHHVATASNADELNEAFFDRLMSESPRGSDAGSNVHHDWQIVPQGHRERNEQAGLSENREMVPAFAPEHRPAYFVEEPVTSDAGSSRHEPQGAVGRHDPNAPRIEEVTTSRPDHIVIDIPSESSSSRVGSTARPGGATGAGATGRIGETSEVRGAAPLERIAQAVGSVRSMLQHVMNNDFTHPLPRWGANIAHAAMRDGATVLVATALREVVGYLVAQATARGTAHAQAQGPSHLAASEHAQVLASAGIIAGVAGLNLMALAYNGRSGRQTARSVPSQAFNLAALGAASAAAYGTGTLGGIMPLLAKAVAYTGLRDGMNLFTSLSSNREQLAPHASQSNMAANWSEMLVYSANQFVVSTLQGRPPAHSGTSSWAQEHSLHHVIPNLLAFAAANAGGEIADSTVYPALEAYHDAGGGRAGLHAVGETRLTASLRTPMSTAASQNIPTHEAIARHLLGPFTARTTMFATLYATAGALSRLHPTHHINENGVTQVTTAILSALTGLLVVPFITSLDTGAPAQHENEERDLEMGEHPPA